MTKRKSISKKKRFDVFKRDNFTCQYCGKQAPNVVLEVDHIKPISKGGTNGMLNLITSCFDCNRGKSNKELKDNQTLTKELKQLELLSERKQQIEMMFKWKNELLNQENNIVDGILEYFEGLTGISNFVFGKPALKKALIKYNVDEILNALKVLDSNEGNDPYDIFDNLLRMLSSLRLQKKKPYMKQIFYIRGIIRNRLSDSYYDNKKALTMLVRWYEKYNISLEELTQLATTITSWNDFEDSEYTYESY